MLLGFVAQPAAMRAQDRARDIEPQAERMRARLERPEQLFWLCYPRTGIPEAGPPRPLKISVTRADIPPVEADA